MAKDSRSVNCPVRNLQTMLRIIDIEENNTSQVIPDGVYGSQTAKSVMEYQKRHGIPCTGITDEATWDAIVSSYSSAKTDILDAQSLDICMKCHERIQRGQLHPSVVLAQVILKMVEKTCSLPVSPDITGELDGKTADALEWYQTLCDIPVSGELDKLTWKYLALHFPILSSHYIKLNACT